MSIVLKGRSLATIEKLYAAAGSSLRSITELALSGSVLRMSFEGRATS
jgi:hypothetical protein